MRCVPQGDSVKEYHPCANLFPLMGEAEHQELKESISVSGQREPILLLDDQILDGRNRYRACLELGIDPVYREIECADPLQYAIDLNLHRRHLNESQRAMVAAKIANMRQGERTDIEPSANLQKVTSSEVAASKLNVSERSVASAKKVHQNATSELREAVEQGQITVSLAAGLTTAEPAFQREVVERVNAGAKPVEAVRQTRKAHLSDPAPMTGKYRVIYADPPWKYGDTRDGLAGYSAAVDHYPAMSIPDLCDLPVKELAEENSVLFLWTTSPLLEDVFQILNAWGFRYKASIVWDKVGHNVGHYVSVRHEFLLICTRGSCLPDIPTLHDSVVSIEKTREHSRKPDYFRELIDELYPYGSRIELFARGEPPGEWVAWGNESHAV